MLKNMQKYSKLKMLLKSNGMRSLFQGNFFILKIEFFILKNEYK